MDVASGFRFDCCCASCSLLLLFAHTSNRVIALFPFARVRAFTFSRHSFRIRILLLSAIICKNKVNHNVTPLRNPLFSP
uniref:Putative secreted peptide n=1 Tax=Anopheles braziliensis TaxID=58242 RepID=A0A2M3ZNG1_9DIPT